MKRLITQTITGIILLFFCLSCSKHVSSVNQLAKNLFCFKTGSEWTYYDSISHATKKMIVTDYKNTIISKEKRGINCAEMIEIDFSINDISTFTSIESTWLKLIADFNQDNTISDLDEVLLGCHICTPTNELMYISCGKDNNFTPSASYLGTYSVNGITYSDVYVFEDHYTKYYVSEHVGFIRCVDNSLVFDWLLVNKNVQQ